MQKFDVIVIGSGGGTKIAIPAAEVGMKVALVEEDAFGGTCLNRGCIPSKMLIHPAELAVHVRRAGKMGVKLERPVHVAFDEVMHRIKQEVDSTSIAVRRRHETTSGLTVFNGHARFVDDYVMTVNDERLTAPHIFIAVGCRPVIPTVEGLEGTPFMTSREALRAERVPARLLVLGAGYIAAELGGAYSAYGSDVHFLVRSRFLRGLDEDILEEFEKEFRRDITVHQPFHIDRVDYDGALFKVFGAQQDGQQMQVDGDALLVATGVMPDTGALGLENTAILKDGNGFIRVNEFLETNVSGVYALGDCIGNYQFRHTVNFEGEYLMHTVFGQGDFRPINYGPVPYAVFTVPQIAGVGMTEGQLKTLGMDYVAGKATYADSTPGMARVSSNGFVKVLIDRSSRLLLGAHIVGEEASTMIHLFVAMMKKNGTLDDLLDMIFIHPALPEVARDAARDARRLLET